MSKPQSGKERICRTREEIAAILRPGAMCALTIIFVEGRPCFQFVARPAIHDSAMVHDEVSEEHIAECPECAKAESALFVLSPPIPFALVEDKEMRLYQILADAECEGDLEDVFAHEFQSELIPLTTLSITRQCLDKGSMSICIAAHVRGIVFEISCVIEERGGLQFARDPLANLTQNPEHEFTPVFVMTDE